MDASTALNGGAGHGRQGSGGSQQNRASCNPPTSAHRGPGTERTGSAQRVPGDVNKLHRSRDDNNGDDRHRPSSRPQTTLGPCCDCTRTSTCSLKPSASREGCACRAANRRCVSCTCFWQCRNRMSTITSSTGRLQNFFHNAVASISSAADPQSSQICTSILPNESGDGTSLVATTAAADLTSVDSAAAPAVTTEGLPITQQPTPLSQSRSGSQDNSSSVPKGAGRQTQDPSGTTASDLPPPPVDPPLAPPATPAPQATLEPGADLPGYEPTPADLLLDSVYAGGHIHPNDGRHLDGGIRDDQK